MSLEDEISWLRLEVMRREMNNVRGAGDADLSMVRAIKERLEGMAAPDYSDEITAEQIAALNRIVPDDAFSDYKAVEGMAAPSDGLTTRNPVPDGSPPMMPTGVNRTVTIKYGAPGEMAAVGKAREVNRTAREILQPVARKLLAAEWDALHNKIAAALTAASNAPATTGDAMERARAIYDTAMIHGTRGWSKFMGEQAIASIIPQIETALVDVIADALAAEATPITAAEDGAGRAARDVVEAARGLFDNITAITTSTHEADDAIDDLKAALDALATEATPGEGK